MHPGHGYRWAPEAEVLRAGFPEPAERALDVVGGFLVPFGGRHRFWFGGCVAELVWRPFSRKQAPENPHPRDNGGRGVLTCCAGIASRIEVAGLGLPVSVSPAVMGRFRHLLRGILRFVSLYLVKGPRAVVAPAHSFIPRSW
jgi:hypothetical protein